MPQQNELENLLKMFEDSSGFGDPDARRNAELRLQFLLAQQQQERATKATGEQKPDTSLQVASVTARQAIIVALITSVAGLVGIYIGNQHKNADTVERHIKLTTVDSPEPGAVRVVFEVNGQPYSYPSRVIWADVSQYMSQENFPLPLNASSFSVHAFAYFRRSTDGKIVRYDTQEAN